ncbi:Protein PAIR1-like protein [Quillaja saponaria]|uniref:Protein PAIR1-like protein n=1 Tax=Quillaja saponaria TaxID=32244 RepID=A0AAD7PPS2_QUISA|nr:Protein PAIR1-like protein [Quillaja saponaria]
MKMKINKACDLSSISVLPPHARMRSNNVPTGLQASQLRSQPSQQSFSHGLSSQHMMLSQFSQNSLDEAVTNDQRFGSQERESSVKKICSLPPPTYARDESQVPPSRSSTNLMRKWNSAIPDHRSQLSEGLEHRIGIMETSLNRFGMILDSVQSDIMQVNKGTKEVTLETESIRQKLTAQDNFCQLMIKGQEEIKASLDGRLKSLSVQVNRDTCQEKLPEIFMVLSALPQQLEASVLKLQNELHNAFTKEIQVIACSLKSSNPKDPIPSMLSPKVTGNQATSQRKRVPLSNAPEKVNAQATVAPKVEIGGWKSVKKEKATFTDRASSKEHKQKEASSSEECIMEERECRVVIESDEEIDGGFSCLLEKDTDLHRYPIEDVKEETQRILRKARRRKRRYCSPIIVN